MPLKYLIIYTHEASLATFLSTSPDLLTLAGHTPLFTFPMALFFLIVTYENASDIFDTTVWQTYSLIYFNNLKHLRFFKIRACEIKTDKRRLLKSQQLIVQ